MKKAPTHKKKATHPIQKKEEVRQSNDEHIDQDFPGFPHHPSKEKTIHNGSAGAFDATEDTHDDKDSDEDDDDRVIDRKY